MSKLFGGADALSIAADEQDRDLVKDSREAVGLSVGISKRQAHKAQQPKDDSDSLIDALDSLNL